MTDNLAIQQQDNRIFNVITAIVAAFLLLCAAMAWHNNAGYRTTVTESATMQWSSDTSWTGGW